MEKDCRGQWSEYAGGPGGSIGSDAADERRRVFIAPDEPGDDRWRPGTRLSA